MAVAVVTVAVVKTGAQILRHAKADVQIRIAAALGPVANQRAT